MWWSGVAVVVWSAVAIADPKPEYPIEVTDRPQLLPRGVAVLDISLDRSWYLDDHGMLTSKQHAHDLDVTPAYGLGPVELHGHIIGDLVSIGASAELGAGLGTIALTLQYFERQSYRPYEFGQLVTYQKHITAIPKRLGVAGGLQASTVEISLALTDRPPISGTFVNVSAFGSVEIQLARRLAIVPGGHIGGPIQRLEASSGGPSIGAFLGVIVAFHHWDFYADVALNNLSRTALPFANIGFTHRSF